jgi:hypothetical protein
MQAIKQYLESVTDNEDIISDVPDEIYDALSHAFDELGVRAVKTMKTPRFVREDFDTASDSRSYEDEFYDYEHGKGDFFVWVEYHYPTSGHFAAKLAARPEAVVDRVVRETVARLAKSGWHEGIDRFTDELVRIATNDPSLPELYDSALADGVYNALMREDDRLKGRIDDEIWNVMDEDGRSTFTPYDGGEELEAVLEWQARPILRVDIDDNPQITRKPDGTIVVTTKFTIGVRRIKFESDWDWEKEW